ncbi:MAG: galactokinase [Actinomycetota bacterium]
MATMPFDGEIVLSSLDEPGEIRIPLRGPAGPLEGWGRYAAGVVEAMREHDLAVRGFRGVLSSSIPAGAGLSSSSALAAAIGIALLGGERPDHRVLQRAEHLAVGVPCGVMDQIAVLHGVPSHALAIDCGAETWRTVRLPPLGIVVIDTGTRRRLDDGRYAQRREEFERGMERRVRHVTSEKERVARFIASAETGDVETMGRLLDESHASLRDDFAVSAPELDAAVGRARAQEGCLGARLVGAGFAGCVLALVRGRSTAAFVRSVRDSVPGSSAFAVAAVDGAGEL